MTILFSSVTTKESFTKLLTHYFIAEVKISSLLFVDFMPADKKNPNVGGNKQSTSEGKS